MSKPVLHIMDILRWADAHYDRTGGWPDAKSGELFDAPNEKWVNISETKVDASLVIRDQGRLHQGYSRVSFQCELHFPNLLSKSFVLSL